MKQCYGYARVSTSDQNEERQLLALQRLHIEYRNRTANSVQVRVAWQNTIAAQYYYGYTQKFNATIGGVGAGTVTIASASKWSSSSNSARSTTAYTGWVTVPLNTTNKTTVSLSGKYWDDNGTYNWSGSFTVPAY